LISLRRPCFRLSGHGLAFKGFAVTRLIDVAAPALFTALTLTRLPVAAAD